ncbi:glycosyltransferase involved in cell wall biosynthesis [Streptomyces griseochromogenes]|uniref:D-inositol 3-phosphate glycosyltransferase n=1 Tax=Streptomyces griseochromogenes TaxID=68214 RepID=A0A1B1B8J9_9ACTN|nr:glycosyltransferase [Streptomyces griseochromogenes]ANP55160.1 glycosyl transferase [Streptomyces griseochromogenes]MBP2050405.1 glycosyltransferase involved in cell wall biosynthesis [Streptomyces griseochromogenes]
MRVLHIITGLGVGGAEQQLRLLVRHLPAQCDVITLTDPGQVAEGLAADGVRVTHVPMRGNRDVAALFRLTGQIRAGRYDLVHTHLYRACVYGRIAARLAGVRAVVATEHSLCATRLEGRTLNAGIRALYLATERLGRVTVAVSPTVAALLRRWGVPDGRIHVVPNGLDADRFRFDEVSRKEARAFYGLPEDAYVVGGIGRLVPAKRFDVVVRAVARMPGDTRLLLAGSGPEEEALRRTVRELGIADRVVLAGDLPYLPDPRGDAPDMATLLSAMDVLAAPGTDETFGLAVLEALAAGLPVLYTTAPALEDLPPHTAPGARRLTGGAEEFARELLRLRAAGPGERAVPDVVRHYGIERTSRQLMDVYTAVLSGTTWK